MNECLDKEGITADIICPFLVQTPANCQQCLHIHERMKPYILVGVQNLRGQDYGYGLWLYITTFKSRQVGTVHIKAIKRLKKIMD